MSWHLCSIKSHTGGTAEEGTLGSEGKLYQMTWKERFLRGSD